MIVFVEQCIYKLVKICMNHGMQRYSECQTCKIGAEEGFPVAIWSLAPLSSSSHNGVIRESR